METTLGKVGTFTNGFPFKPGDLNGATFPVVRIKQLLDPSAEIDFTNRVIPEGNRIDDGDLIFSWSGTLASRIWNRGPALLNQHLFKVVEAHGVQRGWLHLALDNAIEDLFDKTHGTTMKHITKGVLESHVVFLPPLPVQHRLVDFMSHLDNHLANLRNERDAATSFAVALRQQILKPGPDWFVGVLGDVVNIQVGFPFKSTKYTDSEEDIRLLRGDNIEPRGLRWTKAKRWPRGIGADVAEYLLSDGDVVIAMDRTWISAGLKIARVTIKDLPALLVQRVARLTAKSNVRQELIRHLVDGPEFEHLVRNEQTGTSVPHISSKQIASFPIAIPTDLTEQKNIASLLDCSTQIMEKLDLELSKIEIARDHLLAELFSNRISLPIDYDTFVTQVA